MSIADAGVKQGGLNCRLGWHFLGVEQIIAILYQVKRIPVYGVPLRLASIPYDARCHTDLLNLSRISGRSF